MTSTPVDLAYATYGPDNDNPPIIFLHGVTIYKEHWADIPKMVAEKLQRKVYAVDARNHGDSPWTDEYNFDMNVDDLLHFMDKHNIKKATLVGHSMGGITSLKTALKAPHRVEKVVSEDMGTGKIDQALTEILVGSMKITQEVLSTLPTDMDEKEAIRSLFKQVLQKIPEEMAKMMKPETLKRYEEIMVLKKTNEGHYTVKANLELIIRSMKDIESLIGPYAGLYSGPTYVICGELSQFKVWEDQDNVKEFFPNAEFTKVEDATHDVHTDKPEEFKKLLLSFLLKN